MGTDGHGDLADSADKLGAREVVKLVSRGLFHVGVVAGFLAVLAMLVTAAGWRRWAERKAPDRASPAGPSAWPSSPPPPR